MAFLFITTELVMFVCFRLEKEIFTIDLHGRAWADNN